MLFQRKHFLNSQKITLRFRRLRKVTFAPKRSPEGHQEKKKHLRETRKCLIFSVDQPGLEICYKLQSGKKVEITPTYKA